jgi:cell division protein FtsL
MAMVVVALLIVVAGQAMLASGQVRMARLDQQVVIAQAEHRQKELEVSQRETPDRIVGAAKGLVRTTHVTQVPSVSLHTPLPTPTVTPASQ